MDNFPEAGAGFPYPGGFESLAEWVAHCEAMGVMLVWQVPAAIARVMKGLGLDHGNAFDWMVEHRVLHFADKFAIVDNRALAEELVAELVRLGRFPR